MKIATVFFWRFRVLRYVFVFVFVLRGTRGNPVFRL